LRKKKNRGLLAPVSLGMSDIKPPIRISPRPSRLLYTDITLSECQEQIIKRRALMMGLLFCSMMSWSGARLFAQQIDKADVQEIHAVVQAQLEAFAEDDAEKAFELATASTKLLLGTPDNLLWLVKTQYPPVYRHRYAIFLAPEMVDGDPHQIVRLTDRDNLVWVAVYKLKREQDGSWKIDGCTLFETNSISV
jgi:hypothetical protein